MTRCDRCGARLSTCGGRCRLALPPQDPESRLTLEEVRALKLAGRWGLLRPQSRKRFVLTGDFSMAGADMRFLVQAAGGGCWTDGWPVGEPVDALVVGADPDAQLVARAWASGMEVLDEEGLVLQLVPLLSVLEAKPGQAPF